MSTVKPSPRSLLLAAVFATTLFGCGQSQQAGGPPQAQEAEVTVVTIAPEEVTLTTVLAGRTSPYQVSDVRPQVGGIVQKRLFKEGSDVKAGELLYQIDPATYQAAYDNAKATLAKAQANALPARLKGDRYTNLSKVNAVSQQDNDDAQAAKLQAEAEVISAQAALETARINLSYTRVTAPIAGRIGKSTVTPGALVTASQADALTTVQQTNPMYVDVTQSSSEVLRLKRDLASGKLKKAGADGAKVKLLFEDGAQYQHEGALQFSDITVDQSTGVITLRALFPNPNQDLLPGLYVRAVLEEGVEENAILVPQAALSRDSKGNAVVMTVKADNTVEVRPIQVTRVVGDKWLVADGLVPGDRVIVEGLQKAKPGAKVKPVEKGAAAPAASAAPAGAAPQAQANATDPAPKAEVSKATAPAPKAEAKPEAKASAPKTEAPKSDKPAKSEAKPAPTKTDAPKTDSAKADATKADAAKAPAKRDLVYSPPKDQPWPGSTGSAAQNTEPTPKQ
ncbi:efflux RND transporter periplasmic adaptor subunit [Humidesulfovibrio sp.]